MPMGGRKKSLPLGTMGCQGFSMSPLPWELGKSLEYDLPSLQFTSGPVARVSRIAPAHGQSASSIPGEHRWS